MEQANLELYKPVYYDLAMEFRKFNEQFFENRLPLAHIVTNYNKSRFGYYRNHPSYGHMIAISCELCRTWLETQSTLLHEMVHYYLEYTNQRDATSHGPNFKRMINHINQITNNKYRLKVSGSVYSGGPKDLMDIIDNTASTSIDSNIQLVINSTQTGPTQYTIMICHFYDGRHLLCNVSRDAVFELKKKIDNHLFKRTKSCNIYVSNNVAYKTFRKCRTCLSGYFVTEDLIPKLDLHPFVNDIAEFL